MSVIGNAQQFIGLTQDQATRIVNAVKVVEGLNTTTGFPQGPSTYRTGSTLLLRGKITTELNYDSTLAPEDRKGQFQPYYTSNPYDDTSTDTSAVDGPFDCWGYAMIDPTTIDVGTEVICGYSGGRWYVISAAAGGYMSVGIYSTYPSTTSVPSQGNITYTSQNWMVGFTTTDMQNFVVPDDGTYCAIATASFKPGWTASTSNLSEDVVLGIEGVLSVQNCTNCGYINVPQYTLGAGPSLSSTNNFVSLGYSCVVAQGIFSGASGGALYTTFNSSANLALATDNVDLQVFPIG